MRIYIVVFMLFSEFLVAQVKAGENISVMRHRTKTSGFYWIETIENTILGLKPYLWMDASLGSYFQGTSGNVISCAAPNEVHIAQTWLDRSGNDRDFVAPSTVASPSYKCDSQVRPLYQLDGYLEGDGTDDTMSFNFETAPAGTEDGVSGVIDTDFTFIFVMQAVDEVPSANDSFIASGEYGIAKNWQIGTTGNDLNNIYFRLTNASNSNYNVQLHGYDTNPHVYFIQRKTATVTFKVDGNLVATETYPTNKLPTLRELKLYTNRASNVNINAHFSEFFVFTGSLTSDQEFGIQQYLLSKWGV